MKDPAKKVPRGAKGYVLIDRQEFWIAHSAENPTSGFLLFNKRNQTYHAHTSPIHTEFPRLAKGAYKSAEDCPVDANHSPKGDFLMLLALRRRFQEGAPGSEATERGWRELAFRKRRAEVEEQSGKPLSEVNWMHAMEIAASRTKFEKYVCEWLVDLVSGKNAAEVLLRFSKWIQKAEEIESERVLRTYTRFFEAVETAAMHIEGVPKQKEVEEAYNDGETANLRIGNEAFRSVMRQLQFDWLPRGGRGKAAR